MPLWLSVFFIAISLTSHIAWSQSPPPSPMSKIELDWESVPGASHYDLEFTFNEADAKPQVYKSETTKFSSDMLAGTYKFRIRSVTAKEGPGE